jgi:hypothetical protein
MILKFVVFYDGPSQRDCIFLASFPLHRSTDEMCGGNVGQHTEFLGTTVESTIRSLRAWRGFQAGERFSVFGAEIAS